MAVVPRRVFLLSPARMDGVRAVSLREKSKGDLAQRLKARDGVPIGEVFKYLSGLYFRGKLAYASRFAAPPDPPSWLGSGALVITSNRGIVPIETRVTMEHLEAFAETNIHEDDARFRSPLVRDATMIAEMVDEVVLLGSIARAKYTQPLIEVFGDRLLFPTDFVGRGDMSRGGLLLRKVDEGVELAYGKVRGAVLHGSRPPKLTPR